MSISLTNETKNSAISPTNGSKNSLTVTNETKTGLLRVGDLPGSYFTGLTPDSIVPGSGGLRLGDVTPDTYISSFIVTNENKN